MQKKKKYLWCELSCLIYNLETHKEIKGHPLKRKKSRQSFKQSEKNKQRIKTEHKKSSIHFSQF